MGLDDNQEPDMKTITSQKQCWAISELRKAVIRYKSTRTRYANRPGVENFRYLNRAENTLIAAARTAASTIADR